MLGRFVSSAVLLLAAVFIYLAFDEIFVVGGSFVARFLPVLSNEQEYLKMMKATAPNYDDPLTWSALPTKFDLADVLPPDASTRGFVDNQHLADVDAFFVNPTTYFGIGFWNAPIKTDDKASELNPLLWLSHWLTGICNMVHATPYNHIAKIYSPKYRSLSGMGFLSKDSVSVKIATDVAYGDILKAFEKYLEWSEKPFILVGHSQGSMHLARLLREVIAPNQKLRDRLIVAYLLGAAITVDSIGGLPVCSSPAQIGCVVGYNLFIRGGNPSRFLLLPTDEVRAKATLDSLICVNPLSWRRDSDFMPKSANKGSRPLPVHQVFIT